METSVWLGVDIGKDTLHAAVAVQRLFGQGWRKLPCASFEHSATGMRALLSGIEKNSVAPDSLDGECIESTGRCSQQFFNLAQVRLGGVSIINPAHSKSFVKSLGFKHKNDSVDARALASLLQANFFPECFMLPCELRELRRALRYRNLLKCESTRFKNRLACFPVENRQQQTKVPHDREERALVVCLRAYIARVVRVHS